MEKHNTSIRGNIVLTKGFSGQNMKKKYSCGGMPQITTTGMKDSVAQMILPVLEYLSYKVHVKGYTPRVDSALNELKSADWIPEGNYYEAMAVAMTRGAQVLPHLDRENDWRSGYDIMGALTYSGHDSKGQFRIGIFGYTRKCVGDYIQWKSNNNTTH